MTVPFPVRSVLVVLLASGVGACATKSDVQDLRTEVRSEIGQVHDTQDSLRAGLEAIRSQLDRMEGGQKDLIVGRSSELARQIEQLQTQISQLTALVGQTQQRLESRLSRGAPVPGDTSAAETGMDSPAGEDEEAEAAALYQAALDQFRREAYGTARGALEDFLSQYSAHRLAPDARYYLGRTFEETDQEDRALDAYRRVVELHPNSNRAPSALYRLGLVHLDQGQVEEARRFFEQVIRGYPDSPEADPAMRQLEKIGGG